MFAQVLVELKAKRIDKTFTYIIPDKFKDKVKIGIRVIVMFGHQQLEGFVLDIVSDACYDYELKEIIDIVDINPVLNNEMLQLGKYVSKKTMCNLISAYQSMLPVALKAHKTVSVNKKYLTYIKLIDKSYIPKNNLQARIIDILKNGDVLKSELTKISISSISTLLSYNVIQEVKEEIYRYNSNVFSCDKKIILNEEQIKAVQAVLKDLNKFIPFLLFGVTGSGKTQVYINIINEVLKLKKQVIVLVPEISLTPQMVMIFKSKFKDNIAILHSALSDGEKYDEWRRIEREEVSIVVGARSAIFAPFKNLGLIVLDEEHSDTYKQDCNPRYNTIDIAIKRAKTHNCPVILGSATPSIESYTRAMNGIYKMLTLKRRINNSLPQIKIIDMRESIKKGNRILSQELINNINECLKKEEQILLLLNRRGYSTVITCNNCGNVLKCPHCDIPLTYHKISNKLNCHYCNYTIYKPKECPACNSLNINQYGMGTEKLEEEINKLFPLAKTVRMDNDTTSKKGSHEKIILSFKNKEFNVLIGTQMISKGLDFEDVTLVGVINGDSTLNIPDYRSGERTFSLLNQVAGRSGRSVKKGNVIIQCFNTEHYSIVSACMNDYDMFYNKEMNIRKKLLYPPYYNLCVIRLSGTDLSYLNIESTKVYKTLSSLKNIILLGPSMSSIPKIYNKYHMQLIIKYKDIRTIYDSLEFIINKNKTNNKVLIEIDFNPKKI